MKRFLSLAVLLACGTISLAEGVVPKPEKFVSREQWGSKPDPIPDSRKHTPKWVTIHHAGVLWTNKVDPAISVKNLQDYGKKRPHIEKPPRDTYWPDVPYHFLIAPDGRIFEGRDVAYEPDTNTRYEVAGNINVELMGSLGRQRPSREQIQSCVAITAWLCQELKIDAANIRGHKDAAPGQTDCPGKDFARYLDSGEMKQWVAKMLAGEKVEVEPGPPLPGGPTESILDTRPPATAPATAPAAKP